MLAEDTIDCYPFRVMNLEDINNFIRFIKRIYELNIQLITKTHNII